MNPEKINIMTIKYINSGTLKAKFDCMLMPWKLEFYDCKLWTNGDGKTTVSWPDAEFQVGDKKKYKKLVKFKDFDLDAKMQAMVIEAIQNYKGSHGQEQSSPQSQAASDPSPLPF